VATGAASSAPLSLVDENGAAGSATVSWSSPAGALQLPITDQPGNARMMKGYLDTSNTSATTVTIAGLRQGSYDVYVYADGDNKIYDRGAAYTVSGAGVTTTTIDLADAANANFAGSFVPAANSAGNYVRFSIVATGFTLQATPTTPDTGTRRAPINGIQIVPTSVAPLPIGIDFTGSNPSAMAASEIAGVVSQSHWNSAAGAARATPLSLLDAAGAATGASVTWTANAGWSVPIADDPGDLRMMRGYLDTSSASSTTVTVSGLPSGAYDIYVYADGDNHEFSRSASYRLSAPGAADATIALTDAASTNFSGTFTEAAGGAGNYVKFAVTGSGFTLVATPTSGTNATLRAPINAIQIVAR